MIKKILVSAALLLPIFLFGQNEDDALRYSYFNTVGTARFTAMGGAMGALGADFSALSTNPASIGFYRRTEVTFTPSLYLDNTSNTYYGTSKNALPRFNINIGNLGLVVTSLNEDLESRLKGRRLSTRERKRVKGWMASAFAIGINRQMGFQQNFVAEGVNTQSSIGDVFAANSQGLDYNNQSLNPFAEGLAFLTYVTDTVNGDPTQYVSYIPHAGTLQRFENRTKGSLSEIVFSYGANYNHKWYFGGTLGIPRIRYTQQSTYYETDPLDTIGPVENAYFDSLKYTQDMVAKGSGINLKLGVIFRPSDRVRFGLAFHTPSYLRITQNFEATMSTRFNTVQTFSSKSPGGQFSYNLYNPLRAIASVAIIFGKRGLVSAEYELIPYNMARISQPGFNFDAENEAIKSKYAVTGNAKLGGEIRLTDALAWRAGFTYFGNPFKNTLANSRTAFNASTGIGIRRDGLFCDLTYQFGYRSQQYYIYDSSFTQPTTYKQYISSLLCTVGIRF